jgi:hypothetical protein
VKVVNRIVNGRSAITAAMALRLGAALGTSPEFWLNAQKAVDLYRASLEATELPQPLRSTEAAMPGVALPPELLWDYRKPPDDPDWSLQRIAEWFPAFGRDRATVAQLYGRRHALKIPPEVRTLIEIYEQIWREREAERGDR